MKGNQMKRSKATILHGSHSNHTQESKVMMLPSVKDQDTRKKIYQWLCGRSEQTAGGWEGRQRWTGGSQSWKARQVVKSWGRAAGARWSVSKMSRTGTRNQHKGELDSKAIFRPWQEASYRLPEVAGTSLGLKYVTIICTLEETWNSNFTNSSVRSDEMKMTEFFWLSSPRQSPQRRPYYLVEATRIRVIPMWCRTLKI